MQTALAEQRPTTSEALDELQDILRAACAGGSPQRISAVRYVQCRAVLLDSELRRFLPGFLGQCVSIFRFNEFISLYHASEKARIGFVDDSLSACRVELGTVPTYDVFSDPEF